MTQLSVNVNKVATLRNSRGKNNPNVLKTVLDVISYGAQGITVHPRPDGRHIRVADVHAIAENISVEFNIEGYPTSEYLALIKAIKPAQATLVPDPPEALTSNAGWKVAANMDFLKKVVADLHTCGVRVSLFIDPLEITKNDVSLLKKIGTDRVEFYTESYAEAHEKKNPNKILKKYREIADYLCAENIEINAGHDLNLHNLKPLVQAIPEIKEVSIGHALVCDALYLGWQETIKRYLDCLR